ncbi:MAG: helix-turn-helix domain-containing protein [archaeon]|nr:helix-turn-helix domain-containing protein [archaeon]
MFELQVVSNTPMTGVDDLDVLAETFLVQIGYLPKGYDPRSAGALSVRDSIPYRLFMDFFMKYPAKVWTAEELALNLDTSKPTIYRHVNKLRSMDLLESADVTCEDGQVRKGFRVRYGDLEKAWSFTEANVNMAMENYKKTVIRFQQLVKERAEKS